MKKEYEKFIAYIILNLFIPLVPFVFEIIYTNTLTKKSFVMGCAMYGLSIALSSGNLANFAICLLYSFIMAGTFGRYNPNESIINIFQMFEFYGLIFILIFNTIERYKRHVINKEEVFIFMKNGG